MLGRILISGSIGVVGCVTVSYGVASLPCRLASRSADTICQMSSFGRVLDSWKFGFVVGGLVGLIWNPRHQLISRFQPVHLSAASLITLSIYFSSSQSAGVSSVSLNNLEPRVNTSSYSPRLSAFLATIRWAETGTSEPESYRKLVFKGTFDDFSTHPLKKQCAPINNKEVCSTAAGAYQMLDKSWYDLQPKLNLKDFSPASQDKMAIEYIRRNNALSDIEAGRFDTAACKVGRVWASFICNSYNQNPRNLEELRSYYQKILVISETRK
ncbi:lysozyme (plasmid) [Brasilonema octagenarum UFV-E1]|uniref:Lysozyme n=2 Tax=Brasilonema TaxID=383614 RepID=A0A856MPA9_9CYAN|nr:MULTISPECIES: lysozyme [Brasilonema]NMF65725.1 lysozyme [Brasilonema octagenarum UFV-OR1]QDL12568.1 lysozyme [Brasilonema sennae CENA114]QDL18962.1 lysozyme [Brasilonema octagenarum UFV-E1]